MLPTWIARLVGPRVGLRSNCQRTKAYRLILEPLEERSLLTTGLGSTAPAQFVDGLYAHLLQRQPSAGELEIWSLQLNDGASPGQIARSFIDSNEFRGDLITAAYQQYLGRNPEPGAINLWTQQMAAGLSSQSFLSEVVSSNEYLKDHGGASATWVTSLYTNLLSRQPDQSGLAAWTQGLNHGATPAAIAQGFVYSPEFLGIQVNSTYQSLLGRSVDPTGLTDWVSALTHGVSWEQFTDLIASSGEFVSNQITLSPPTLSGGGQTTATGITLVTPGFSSTGTPTVALNVTPSGYSGTVYIDVDLNHDGSFIDGGDLAQTVGSITPQNNQLVLTDLANGTYSIRARIQGSGVQTVVSQTVSITINTNQGFIGATDLLSLYNSYTSDASQGGLPANFFNRKVNPENFNGHNVGLNVHSTLLQDLNGLAADLTNLGMTVYQVDATQQMVIGYMPISMIPQLTSLPNFASVTPIYAPEAALGSAESQGDAAILAPTFRAQQGADGTGETIGILSDSVNQYQGGLSQSYSTGDLLPSHVKVLEDLPAGMNGTDEGRAMMEISADVAPGSNQIFHTGFISPQDFANGIIQLAANGAGAIADDIGYSDEPMFNDGVISQAAEQVHNQGVFYASAAGNDGPAGFLTSWKSTQATVAGTSGTFLDLGGGNVLQTFSLAPGETFYPDVQWDDAFLEGGSSAPNYQVKSEIDVYITDASGSTVLQTLNNNSLNTGEAVQYGTYTNTGSTTLQLAMAFQLAQGPAPTMLRWIDFSDDGYNPQALGQGGPVIFGHPAAAGVVATAASPWYSPSTPEFYTSIGGNIPILFDSQGNRLATPQIRVEPVVTGPDGVDTSFFGSPAMPGDPDTTDTHLRFYGTSAAAPHVAAASLLYFEKYPGITANEILMQLETGTLPAPNPGYNPTGGNGFIQVLPITGGLTGPTGTTGPTGGAPTGNAPWGQTSNTAANLGGLTGTQSFSDMAIKNQPDGLPGNQWAEWTADQSGTFSAQLQYSIAGGDLNFRLYELDSAGDLIQLASGTSLGATSQSLTAPVTSGETVLLWIYGYNHAQGNFTLNVGIG